MIPCCYPSVNKCCHAPDQSRTDLIHHHSRNRINMAGSSGAGGGGGGGEALNLCFGSLGRFAMEGGKVMLGCEVETDRWAEEEEEEEEAAPAVARPRMKQLPSSPQSTLAGAGFSAGSTFGWDSSTSSTISPSSSASSPTGGLLSSGVSSPPTPIAPASDGPPSALGHDDALDALCAELLRLKMEGEMRARAQQLHQVQLLRQQKHYQNLLLQMRSAQAAAQPPSLWALDVGVEEEAVEKSHNMHEQGHGKGMPRRQGRGAWNWSHGGKQGRSRGGPAHYGGEGESVGNSQGASRAAHYAQQLGSVGAPAGANGSGMRAVFLTGSAGSRNPRESSGTGVFLPRRPDTKSRKLGCSTVLLPSRIVHALNLNVADTLPSPPISAPRDLSMEGPLWLREGLSQTQTQSQSQSQLGGMYCNHRMTSASRQADNITLQEVAPDISLPTEWIY